MTLSSRDLMNGITHTLHIRCTHLECQTLTKELLTTLHIVKTDMQKNGLLQQRDKFDKNK